jgi:hypothetical protein
MYIQTTKFQLKHAVSLLSPLTEETKPVKQTLHKASNTYNPRLTTNPNKLYGRHSVQPPSRKPSTYGMNGTPNTYPYSVPTVNRHTVLLNYQEPQPTCEMTSPTNNEYLSGFMVAKNCKYTTRTPSEKKATTNQHTSSRTPPSNKHNLQEWRESDDETNYISTIIYTKNLPYRTCVL